MSAWHTARIAVGVWGVSLILVWTTAVARDPQADSVAALDAGRAMYLRGALESGAELVGTRGENGAATHGVDAACVSCHQRSGLGSTEGLFAIPPITPQFLFQPRDGRVQDHNLPYIPTARTNRTPYTDATLARVIRDGVDPDGHSLNALMPRFALDDTQMTGLIKYIHSLDVQHAPGVTDSVLNFATIFTPDADPVKRQAVLQVIEQYFAEKNSFQFGPGVHMNTSGKTLYSKSMFMVNRRWQLHVWDLTGPAETWQAQLEQKLANDPVFAVVSGLGGANWAPVHHFCEKAELPCLFPNVDVPVDASEDFYPVYFSKGVLLEAELIAKQILDADPAARVKTVQQVYRAGDSGEAGARALEALLAPSGIELRTQVLPAGGVGSGLKQPMHRAAEADAAVLWLRGGDIAALSTVPDPPKRVYLSGLMGGLEEAPLPPAWRERTKMAYPVDLPDRRVVRLDYPMGWFRIKKIPVVAPQVQADTYLACGLLAETVGHMSENFVRPYLIEQVQQMIAHRIITGYYPRLTLGTRQRFASKGGYVVHFAGPAGSGLVAETDWTVPWPTPAAPRRANAQVAPAAAGEARL